MLSVHDDTTSPASPASPTRSLSIPPSHLLDLIVDARCLMAQRGRRREASLKIAEYVQHRLMGVAQPENGDVRLLAAIVALGDEADAMSDALHSANNLTNRRSVR